MTQLASAHALRDERAAAKPRTNHSVSTSPAAVPPRERGSLDDTRFNQVSQALRSFNLLLRAHRLDNLSHPRVLDSLDQAYDGLRSSAVTLNGFDLRIERGGIVVPKLNEGHLPDVRGEFHSLAADLQRAGIHAIFFSIKFHVGELDTLTHLITDALLRSEEAAKRLGVGGWPARLREHRVTGIQINTLTERKVDSVLASLIAALVAYGGNAPEESGDTPIRAPQVGEISDSLRLIGRLTPPMEVARGLSAEDAARAIHSSMASQPGNRAHLAQRDDPLCPARG